MRRRCVPAGATLTSGRCASCVLEGADLFSTRVLPRRRRPGTPLMEERVMIVPLTLGDFLERAELVYGAREAVVDEPNPPGGGLGRFTYAELAAMARSLAAALDDLGVGENERVAIVSPNAA